MAKLKRVDNLKRGDKKPEVSIDPSVGGDRKTDEFKGLIDPLIAARMAKLKKGRPAENVNGQLCPFIDDAASLLNVSPRRVKSAKHVSPLVAVFVDSQK